MTYLKQFKLIIAGEAVEFGYGSTVRGADPAPRVQVWTNEPLEWCVIWLDRYVQKDNGTGVSIKGPAKIGDADVTIYELPYPAVKGANSFFLNLGGNVGAQHLLFYYDQVQPEPTPVPIPTPLPVPEPVPSPVRADTLLAVTAAIANGAKHIQTTGFDLNGPLDCLGALIELLPGGPSWKPAVKIYGAGSLSNARVKTPPSVYSAAGQRTQFWKAIEVDSNADARLKNVSFETGTGFCIHNFGKLRLENVWASTFSEYWYFGQDAKADVVAIDSGYRGGSAAESGFRVMGSRYDLSDCTLDNRKGGKAALRGDSPMRADGSPGGVARRCTFYGQVGPNPLTEDDGGQMVGIDRWRVKETFLFQLDGSMKPKVLARLAALRAAGKGRFEIVRTLADEFVDPNQLAAAAFGKRRLTDADINLTLDFRDQEIGRFSVALFENCQVYGQYRFNSRERLRIVGGSVEGDEPLSAGSQSVYPYPVDRTLSDNEPKPPPDVELKDVRVIARKIIGLDLAKWPSIKTTGTTSVRLETVS